MSWYDYVPGVANVAGAVKGDWAEAAGGAGTTLLRKGKDLATPATPDLSASQGAGQRAQAATQDFAGQRAAYQPQAAPQIGPSGGVSTPGAPPAAYGAAPGSPPAAAAPPGAPPAVGGGVPGTPSQVVALPGGGFGTTGPAVQSRSGIGAFAPPSSAQPAGAGAPPVTDQSRQQGALDMLQGAAMGTAPSAAQIQSGQQLGTAMANQYAMASGLQGRHPGAAFDAASRGAATVQGNVIGQGAVQRATEQAQARDAYAAATGGARGQDIQVDTANLSAKLTAMGYDEQTKNALLSAQLQAQGYDVSTANAIINAQAQAAQSANAYKGAIVSGVVGGATKAFSGGA